MKQNEMIQAIFDVVHNTVIYNIQYQSHSSGTLSLMTINTDLLNMYVVLKMILFDVFNNFACVFFSFQYWIELPHETIKILNQRQHYKLLISTNECHKINQMLWNLDTGVQYLTDCYLISN